MTTWFTSDLHLFHRNIMQHYDHRGCYADENEMSEGIIKSFNSRVQPRDTVYILGDIGWDTDLTVEAFSRLHGRKFVVPGNHDKGLIKVKAFQELCTILPQYSEIKVDGTRVCMCHFPIWEWNQMSHGSWHLHGHMHGSPTGIPGRILDVSADGNLMLPYSLDEVRAFMESRPIRAHH